MTAIRFWLFGSTQSTEEVCRRLADIEPVEFEPHESSYFGDYYLGVRTLIRDLTVKTNFEDDEGHLLEEAFAEVPTLVFVSQNSGDPDKWHWEEIGLKLLRVSEWHQATP